jgi:hypothetical protein
MTEVSAAIIIKDDKILLAQRSNLDSLPGYWDFQGVNGRNRRPYLSVWKGKYRKNYRSNIKL